VWHGGSQGEPALLADCYRSSLRLAAESGLKSIAFPAISTGVYHYPKEPAARIAVGTIREFLKDRDMEVLLVAFGESDEELYRRLIEEGDAE
jgi:O-acetyl-ADP-ribose deacetylase (regulator of RNase III)